MEQLADMLRGAAVIARRGDIPPPEWIEVARDLTDDAFVRIYHPERGPNGPPIVAVDLRVDTILAKADEGAA